MRPVQLALAFRALLGELHVHDNVRKHVEDRPSAERIWAMSAWPTANGHGVAPAARWAFKHIVPGVGVYYHGQSLVLFNV